MNSLFKRIGFTKNNITNVRVALRYIYGATEFKYDESNNENKYNKSKFSQKVVFGVIGLTTCVGVYNIFDKHNKYAYTDAQENNESTFEAGVFDPNLPIYSMTEVSQHNALEKEIWVIFKQGVYNITDYIESHPGGKIILRAAGQSIEPFWIIYGLHKNEDIYKILELMRIGNISKEDAENNSDKIRDPYKDEPSRHGLLKPACVKPFNAEPNASVLVEKFVTPNNVFYVRNHLPVPLVDPNKYTLNIEIEDKSKKSISLTLDELKKFKKHNVQAVIMCAGNRRSEMSEVKPVKGLHWGNSVIGNAVWSGVLLRDVLLSMGITDDSKYRHIQFEGMDIDPVNKDRFYGASVPFNIVMDKHGDVLLAYEMNGEPLPRDHGYPVRVLVPGVCGARNVKWLSKIVVSKEESKAFWQQNDYKSFNSSTDFESADYSKADSIQKLPITSAICVPQPGETVELKNDCVTVKGYAYSGGGNKILRVDVTANAGETWHIAKLENENKDSPNYWSWTLWSVDIPVHKKSKEIEIWVKAMDSCHNTQPETFQHIWNIRGVLSNAYHRIKIKLNRSNN